MMRIRFTVSGQPSGYVAQTNHRNKRVNAYYAWRKRIKDTAALAGVKFPLVSTPEAPIVIRTRSFFADKRHKDTLNVHKGVEDALFYIKPKYKKLFKLAGIPFTDDKCNGGSFAPVQFDSRNPRVEIMIQIPVVLGENDEKP